MNASAAAVRRRVSRHDRRCPRAIRHSPQAAGDKRRRHGPERRRAGKSRDGRRRRAGRHDGLMRHREAQQAVRGSVVVARSLVRKRTSTPTIVKADCMIGHRLAAELRARHADEQGLQDQRVEGEPGGELAPEARLRAGCQDGLPWLRQQDSSATRALKPARQIPRACRRTATALPSGHRQGAARGRAADAPALQGLAQVLVMGRSAGCSPLTDGAVLPARRHRAIVAR